MAAGAMAIPLLFNMPKFYADVVWVPSAYLALAIAFTRCFDAIIDPAIGSISDRTRSPWGRRGVRTIFIRRSLGRPRVLGRWMSPPMYLTPVWRGGVVHGVRRMVCSLFPSTAPAARTTRWAPELSLDYNERNGLFGAREAFGVLGTMIAAGAPGLLMQHFNWKRPAGFFPPGAPRSTIALTALCWLMVVGVREQAGFYRASLQDPLVPGIRRSLRNRPFMILLITLCRCRCRCQHGANACRCLSSSPTSYNRPHRCCGYRLVCWHSSGISLVFVPIGVAVARRFGKLRDLDIPPCLLP